MRIKVTDIETGTSSTYDYSDQNWRRTPACMEKGLVIMWAPSELRIHPKLVTSGRRWELLRKEEPAV